MNMIRKKYVAAFALMASIALSLHAEVAYSSMGNNYAYQQDCCAQPVCCEESSGSFFVRGDYLYWKSHVSGVELDYGNTYITENIVDEVQFIDTYELDIDPCFKWDSGYRIGAGYQASNSFEAGIFYTHFQDKGSKTVRQNVDAVDTGDYRLKFNQIDFVVAYNAALNTSFNLKPFLGIRGTQIHDHLNTLLITDIVLDEDVMATETRNFDDRQKFCGVGPLLGFQGDWNVGRGFSVYGTAATSILYGKYKVHLDDTTVWTAPISKNIHNINDRHLREFTCNIDLAIGVNWQTCVFNTCMLNLRVGFEHHQYFRQNHLSANYGDLSFDGGVFSLGLSY